MEIRILRSIEVLPINSVFLYPENPREMEAKQFEKLKKSIQEYGFIDPLIVNKRSHDGFVGEERKPTIMGGNMRWRAATELGLTEVPVAWIDVDRNQEKIINIALNRISGKWDVGKLEKMVYELSDKDLALNLDLTGLEDWELKLYNPGLDANPEEIWKGMPDFDKKSPFNAFKSIIIHFENQVDFDNFTKLIDQKITEKTKYIWFPQKKEEDFKSIEVKSDL